MKRVRKDEIVIRRFTEADIEGVWRVLSDAAYSHIWPGFLLTIKKRTFLVFSLSTAVLVYLVSSSAWIFVYTIIGCVVLLYCVHVTAALYYLYGPPLADMKSVLESYFSDKKSCFWVAENTNQDDPLHIVGTIAVVNRDLEIHGMTSATAWLRRMAVHRQFRGRGVAGRLLQTAIDFCAECNYKKICLITTEVHMAARQLYRKYGFTCIAFKPIFYLKGFFPVWTFEFEKQL